MKDALEKLKEFHRVFQAAASDLPCIPNQETMKLRISLMEEELQETIMAMRCADLTATPDALIEIADGLADLCYVAIGTAVAYGIPLDLVFEEVHISNMRKTFSCGCKDGNIADPACMNCLGTGMFVKRREDGKILKPEGWTPPDIARILKEASR